MKRYFVDGIDFHWQEHPEGWWVGYDDANAEIVRLRDDCDYWKGQTLTKDQRIDEAKAEIARLTVALDAANGTADRNINARIEVEKRWLKAEAEIARLTAERDQMRADFNNELQEMSERFRAVNLVECAKLYDKDMQAEIARLRKPLSELVAVHDNYTPFGGELMLDRIDRIWDEARAALKPDTGEGA